MPRIPQIPEPRGIGWAYCAMFRLLGVKEAQAAEVPQAQDTVPKKQDTTKKADTTKQVDSAKAVIPPAAAQPLTPTPQPAPVVVPPATTPVVAGGGADPNAGKTQAQIAAEAAQQLMKARAALSAPIDPMAGLNSRGVEAKLRLEITERARNRYQIEIHKKFSLAMACLIFAVLAPPIALRFPRGGVGLVIGVSLGVFALYYVGLIGGESAANHGYVPPFWAMWGTNVILTGVGLFMLFRIGRDSGSARGGGLREWFDTRRMLREERRAAAVKA
jgi:lipopolysaccharide export system permease protein